MDYPNRYNLPDRLVPLVDRELALGEAVAWVGQPIPGQLARNQWRTVLFGIPWTAFAIFWTFLAAQGGTKSGQSPWFWLFPLWGVPFILVGLNMLTSPYWARRRAWRTTYVLTNQRAVVITAGWSGRTSVRSFEPDTLKDLRRTERADGTGDLIFAAEVSPDSRGRKNQACFGFLAIKDVKNVEEQIRQLVRKKTGNDA